MKNSIPVSRLFLPLFLVLTVQTANGNVQWLCDEPKWLFEPEFRNGILVAAVGSDCLLEGVPTQGLAHLHKFILGDIEGTKKYAVHSGPQPCKREGLKGVKYDLTDHIKGEGSPLSIRQDLFVGGDDNQLLYASQSTHVQGSGNAGYLKKVSFRTEMHSDHVRFENEVQLERPWFAFSFLFKPIGESITKEKFQLARDKLLEYLAPHL